jgi:hypothetical protein
VTAPGQVDVWAGPDAGQGGHSAKVTTAIATALAAQDVTVPAEAATGRVIAETGDGPAFASLRGPASKAFYDRQRAEGKRQPARPAPGLPRAA